LFLTIDCWTRFKAEIEPLDRYSEVGELTDSFNQMASQLKQAFLALKTDQQRLIDFLEAIPLGVVIR